MDPTAFRKALQTMFESETGAKMVPGVLDGPNEWSSTRWLGSVAIAKEVEDPRNVSQLQIYLLARFFAPFSSQGAISPNEPYDPTPLEQMATKVRRAVARNQTGLGAWYQRVTAVEYDHADQGIQATLFAYAENDSITLA